MDNTKKTILISGASTGIGRHCALGLIKAGFKVLAGVRSEKAGEELAQIAPEQIKPVMLDITDRQSIDSAADLVSAKNLYGLVNNAGIAVVGPLEFLPLEKIRKQFDVNLFGHIAVTQAFLPILRKSEGRIVNMSSVSGLVAFPFLGPYASSKFALEAFSDSLRRELKPWKIMVSLIEPGNIKTPLWNKLLFAAKSTAKNFSPEVEMYYGKKIMNMQHNARWASENASAPSAVADAVLHALTANRPKVRYVVGLAARKYSMLRRLLPDWALDRII
ncbi:MAG: SDR family oxidoreductase [Planctomycetes bacterium]|nr:SDR family oxidoreductase [Planctomycetota bacterium]